MKIKKGDIVSRKSYGNDILFFVSRILKISNDKTFAILKGISIRIEADAPVDDLIIVNKKDAQEAIKKLEEKLLKRIDEKRSSISTGRILHLDGDRKYSEKSIRYYRKMGLNAIVKNIPENKQSQVIIMLLNRYNPDILVITGHDAMIKNGTNYNSMYNYRNSRYFINTVIEARKWKEQKNDLVIFARSMSKLF